LTSRIETKEEVNSSSKVYERGVGATILRIGVTKMEIFNCEYFIND